MAALESMQTKQFSRLSATVGYESLSTAAATAALKADLGRTEGRTRTGQTDGKGEEDAPYSERR